MRNRNYLFWKVDRMKGSPIANNLSEINSSLLLDNDFDRFHKQNLKLKKLLDHATNTTIYYSTLKKTFNLNEFPVVNKALIRNNIEKFKSSLFDGKQLYRMITSGSTGTPFISYQDKNKKIRNYSDTIFFASLAGYEIGDQLFYLKIWSDHNKKSRIQEFMQNIQPVDVLNMNEKVLSKLVNDLVKNTKPKGIIGYSSAIERIDNYLKNNRVSCLNSNVKSIIGISESFNEETKASLETIFGVRPLSRYSNIENGIIAQEDPSQPNLFLINTASYIVELLKLNSDQQCLPGELGRIVVTDLYNFGMPFIRYDTGDTGVHYRADSSSMIRNLVRIEGRKLDLIYNTKGELISSFLVYKNMFKYPEIIQYQLIQVDKTKFIFKINIDERFQRENELRSDFMQYLGEDCEFSIDYVSDIPVLASGKRKKIVNLMH